MDIGPFNVREVEALQNLLNSKGVAFEMYIDKDLEAEILARHHSSANQHPRGTAGRLDLKTVFFEIADADFEKVKEELENYGITALSDGSYELGEQD